MTFSFDNQKEPPLGKICLGATPRRTRVNHFECINVYLDKRHYWLSSFTKNLLGFWYLKGEGLICFTLVRRARTKIQKNWVYMLLYRVELTRKFHGKKRGGAFWDLKRGNFRDAKFCMSSPPPTSVCKSPYNSDSWRVYPWNVSNVNTLMFDYFKVIYTFCCFVHD